MAQLPLVAAQDAVYIACRVDYDSCQIAFWTSHSECVHHAADCMRNGLYPTEACADAIEGLTSALLCDEICNADTLANAVGTIAGNTVTSTNYGVALKLLEKASTLSGSTVVEDFCDVAGTAFGFAVGPS